MKKIYINPQVEIMPVLVESALLSLNDKESNAIRGTIFDSSGDAIIVSIGNSNDPDEDADVIPCAKRWNGFFEW